MDTSTIDRVDLATNSFFLFFPFLSFFFLFTVHVRDRTVYASFASAASPAYSCDGRSRDRERGAWTVQKSAVVSRGEALETPIHTSVHVRRSVTRRETEALSPGFEGGRAKSVSGGGEGMTKVLLRVYSVPSHLILYQAVSRLSRRQSAWIGGSNDDSSEKVVGCLG